MESLKLLVFIVSYIALICVKNNPDAALRDDCSSDPSVCNTTNNEVCNGTNCTCVETHYNNGGTCTLQISYGQPCPSLGTCKDVNVDCISRECRCNNGYFWKDICLPNTNLNPLGVQTWFVPHTQIIVNWQAPSIRYSAFVAGYMVDVFPQISDIIITGTTATLTALVPGEQYTITVKTIINYLNRNETAAAGSVSQAIVPLATGGLSTRTSLNAPNIQIWFKRATGKSSGYKVQLKNENYDRTQYPISTGDLMAEFQDVIAGAYYNLTITTISHGLESAPFTTEVRVKAEASDPVVNLDSGNSTSRSASVSWMKPLRTNGDLYQYLLEIWNGSVCVQQVVFNCTGCDWTKWVTTF